MATKCTDCGAKLNSEESQFIGYGPECIQNIYSKLQPYEVEKTITLGDGTKAKIMEIDRSRAPKEELKKWDTIQSRIQKYRGNSPSVSFGDVMKRMKEKATGWFSFFGKKKQGNEEGFQIEIPAAEIENVQEEEPTPRLVLGAHQKEEAASHRFKGPVSPLQGEENGQKGEKQKKKRTLDDLIQELLQKGHLHLTTAKYGERCEKIKNDVTRRLQEMNIEYKISRLKDKQTKKFVGVAIGVAVASSMVFSQIAGPTYAGTMNQVKPTKFKDAENHWLYRNGTLTWWEDRGISGYGNGQFKPENQVSEAEFYTMIAKAYGEEVSCQAQCTPWYKGAYEMVHQYTMPEYGNPNGKLTRTQVAEIIAAAQGYNYKGDDAVKFLLVNHLSNGRNKPTVAGYEGKATMTRAEAFQFLYNVLMRGKATQVEGPGAYPTDAKKLQEDYQQFLKDKHLVEEPVQQPQQQTPKQVDKVYTVEELKSLEMQYLNSLKFENGYLKGTVPQMDSKYEWIQAFPFYLKNGLDYHLSYYWEVVMEKKFVSGQSFAIPIQKEWGNLSSGRLSESQIKNGTFSVRIQRKQGVNLSVPRVATSMEYPSKKVTVDVNQ